MEIIGVDENYNKPEPEYASFENVDDLMSHCATNPFELENSRLENHFLGWKRLHYGGKPQDDEIFCEIGALVSTGIKKFETLHHTERALSC